MTQPPQKDPTPKPAAAAPAAKAKAQAANAPSAKDARELVQQYLDRGFQLVFWPSVDAQGKPNDWKGPRDKDWLARQYTIEDYHPGDRVGIMHGVEVAPSKFLIDVDVDWAPGIEVAKALLPATQFIWGRASKKLSHCLYTAPDLAPTAAYKDVGGKDAVTLIEFRSHKHQVMAPPSIWQKVASDGTLQSEALQFVVSSGVAHVQQAEILKKRTCLAAVGMLVAKHLGHNGFGHEARLCWAGFLLRMGVSVDDLVAMGAAMSAICNNREVDDVRRVVESTAAALGADAKKVKGGPSLARLIGEQGRAVVNRIKEWLGRENDFVRTNEGVIVAKNQENIRRAMELLDYELSYDQFSDKLLMNVAGQPPRPMEDREVEHAYFQIDSEFHFMPPMEFFKQKIQHLAWQNAFHPVKEYLSKLEWDGTKRIDTWLRDCAGVEDTPYTRAVGAIMLIAAVRRIMHPGCKYDEMVVWESEQGANKSSACAALCPNPKWFSDDLPLNLKSQQLIEATLGKWIVEASDLAGKRKTEIEHLKAMLSRQVDGPARMAYAHFAVERPRHFILVGTTNSAAYLNDPTGARRFWPMKVKRFDLAWIKANRDQLWAEAVVREAAGDSIRLPEHLWPDAAEQQEARREIDPWEHVIRAALLQIEPSSDGKRRVATEQIWNALNLGPEKRDRYGALRISEIMHRLGFERTRVRPLGGEVQVGYAQTNDNLEQHRRADDDVQEEQPLDASEGADGVPF